MIKLIPQAKEKFYMDKETRQCLKDGASFLNQGDVQGFLYSCPGLDLSQCVIALELAGISTLQMITEIPDYFLYGSSFTSEVNLPSHIKWVGELAFAENKNLNIFKVDPENKLEIIGRKVFAYSENLKEVHLENCENLRQIYHNVFKECSSLRNVYLPNPKNRSLEIGENAFPSNVTIHFPTMLKEEFNNKVIWDRYGDPQRIIYFKDGYLELVSMM